MKKQFLIGLVLFAIFIFMGTLPYQAQGANYDNYGVILQTNTSSSALAPWFFETVDTPYDVGQYVSIALDYGSNKPYISYYDASHQSLQLAKFVGSGGNCGLNNAWMCETVDHTGNVGKFSSISIDPSDDLPKIAYYDETNHALKLATLNFGGWNIKTIEDPQIGDVGQYASLDQNPKVKAAIAYYSSNFPGPDALKYAVYVGGGTGNCGGNDFQCDFVDSGENVGKYASLALDSADQPHIAYYDGDKEALMYATYDGGWVLRQISWTGSPSGQFASLAIDVNNGDRPHIAYYDHVYNKLEYAVFVGDFGNCGINGGSFEWECGEIDIMGPGTHPRGISLALDNAGYPIIVYQTGASGLKIARPAAALGLPEGNCGPPVPYYTWQCEVISLGIGISQGDYLSLAINSAGLSTIAYYGDSISSEGNLKTAYQQLQTFLPLLLK